MAAETLKNNNFARQRSGILNKVPCKAWRPVGSAFFDLLGAAEQTLVGLMDTPRFNIKKKPAFRLIWPEFLTFANKAFSFIMFFKIVYFIVIPNIFQNPYFRL